MTTQKIAALTGELAARLGDVDGITAIYAFGSALRAGVPADVDLVVVYAPPLTPETAPSVRKAVAVAVERTFGLDAHLMFFSESEARQPGLLSDLEPQLVYEPHHD
jgi:predicted nucleotidyltransferase